MEIFVACEMIRINAHLWLHELAWTRARRSEFRAETVVFAAKYRYSSIAALAHVYQPLGRVDRNAHRQVELSVAGAVALANAHQVDARVLLVDLRAIDQMRRKRERERERESSNSVLLRAVLLVLTR